MSESIQPKIVGQTKRNLDGEPCLTVMKYRGKVMLWMETEDGEAAVEMTRSQFDAFVTDARKLMRWE